MNCLHKHGFNGDPKLRYRMFKSGKAWVFATTAMLALVAGTDTLVRADQVTTPPAVTAKIPVTHTNPASKSAEQPQPTTSQAGQSNQTISNDSTSLHNDGYTDSENKAVKAATQPTEKSPNSVVASSAATSQPQVATQPASSVAQSTATKATYQAAVSQAHQFAQTATSQAQVVDQYAKVVHDQVTKTKIHQAKQYANEAQIAADLTAQYASLAAVNLAVMTNSTATVSYDAAIAQMKLALNATSSYTAQVLSAAAAAEQAAVTAMRQTANHTYLQFGQVASTASSAALQVNSLTNQARLVAQTDPDSQAIEASVKQVNQLGTTTDQIQSQLKQAWLAAQTANQALQQSDFATVQAALTTLQIQATTASQAAQRLQQATSQANVTLQDLTNFSEEYASSHADQVAKQASQAVNAIQLQLSQAQKYHGDQAKQYASAVSVNLDVARSQAELAGLKAAAVQVSNRLQTILFQSQQAVAAAAIATEQLKEAQQATKLAQQFDTDVKNEKTDHDGAHILLSLSKSQVNINQPFTPDIEVTDLGGNWKGTMTVHGDLTYTWYQSTDGETWQQLQQQTPIKLAAAGKYYLQVVVVGTKWNLFDNVAFKAASNVVAVVVNDQDGGDYQQQVEQALASATVTNNQYVKIKQSATQTYQQAQQLIDMTQQVDVQAAYHELTQQLDQATQTYQQVQAKKTETIKLMAANQYAQAKLAAQATEKLAMNLKNQVAIAATTWQQVQAKLESALTAAAKQQSMAQVQHYLASSYAATAKQAAQAASQAATHAGYATANVQGLAEHAQSFDPDLTSIAHTVSAEAQQASSVAKTVAQAASLASQAATTDDYQLAASQMTIASSAAAQLDQDLAALNPIIQQAVTTLASKQSKYYQSLITTNAHIAGDAEDTMLKADAIVHNLPSDNTTLGSSYVALTQGAVDQTSQAFKMFNQATITMNNQIDKITLALKQGQYSAAVTALSAATEMATAMESLAHKTQQVSANGQKTEKLAIDYSNETNPVFEGRGDAGYAFGIVMVSGMTSQPTALTSTRSGNTIHLSASSRLGLGVPGATSKGSWQVQVHNQWLSLSDARQYFTFHENKRDGNFWAGTMLLNVSNSSSLDVTLAADFVGSLIFQWKATYGTVSGAITTASNLAEVDVYDKDIPATGLTIAGADYVVYSKAQAQQTKDAVLIESQYTAQTTPGNATGEIKWQSNHPDIAAIDDGGMLTVYGPGSVELTATITNADGTVYQAVKHVVIGNGLSDQTAAAGSTLSWQPDGLENVPSDQVTYQWYVAQQPTSEGQAIKGATQATLTLEQLKLSQTGYYYLVVTGKNTAESSQNRETAADTLITLGRAKLTVIGTATASANAAAEQMQLIMDNAKHYQVATDDYAEFTTTYAKQHTGATDYADQAHQAQADLNEHQVTLSTINQHVVDYQQQAIEAENAGKNAEAASLAANAQDYVAQALITQTNISQTTNQARTAAESALKVVDPVIPPTETPGNHATETPGTSNPDDGNVSTHGDGQHNTDNQSNGGTPAKPELPNTDGQATENPTPGHTDTGVGNDNGQPGDGETTNPGAANPGNGANSGDGTTTDTSAGHDNGDNQSETNSINKPGTLHPDGDHEPNTSDNHTNNGGNTIETPGNSSSGDHSTGNSTPGNGANSGDGTTTDTGTGHDDNGNQTGTNSINKPGTSTSNSGNQSGTSDSDDGTTTNATDDHNNSDTHSTGNTPGTSGTDVNANHNNGSGGSDNQSGTGSMTKPDGDHNDGNDQSTSGTPAKPELPNTGDHSTDNNSSDNGQSNGSETTGHGAANSGDGTNTNTGTDHDNSGDASDSHTSTKPGTNESGDNNTQDPAPIVPAPGNGTNSGTADHHSDGDNQSTGSTTEAPGTSTSDGGTDSNMGTNGNNQAGTNKPGDGNTSNPDDSHHDGDNQSTGTSNPDGNQSGHQPGSTTQPDDSHNSGSGQSNGGTPAKPETPNSGNHSTTEPGTTHTGNGSTSTPSDSHNNGTNSGTTDNPDHNGDQSGTQPGGHSKPDTTGDHSDTGNGSSDHVTDQPQTPKPSTPNSGDGTNSGTTDDQHSGSQAGGNTTGATSEKPVGPTTNGQKPEPKPGLTPKPNPIQPTAPDHNNGNQSETGANPGNGRPMHPDVNQPSHNDNAGNANQTGKPNKPNGIHSGDQHVTSKPDDGAHSGPTSHETKPGSSVTPRPQPLPTPDQNTGTTTTDSSQSSQQVKPEKPALNGGDQQVETGSSQTTVSNAGAQGSQQPKPLQPTTNVQANSNVHWVKPGSTAQSQHNPNVSVVESVPTNKPVTQQPVKQPVVTGMTGWHGQVELAKLMSTAGQSATILPAEGHTPTTRFDLASDHNLIVGKNSRSISLPVVHPTVSRDSAGTKATDSKSAHVANQVSTGNMKASAKPASTGMAADHLQGQRRQSKSIWPRLSTWLVIFLVLGLSAWIALIKTRRPKSTK